MDSYTREINVEQVDLWLLINYMLCMIFIDLREQFIVMSIIKYWLTTCQAMPYRNQLLLH